MLNVPLLVPLERGFRSAGPHLQKGVLARRLFARSAQPAVAPWPAIPAYEKVTCAEELFLSRASGRLMSLETLFEVSICRYPVPS